MTTQTITEIELKFLVLSENVAAELELFFEKLNIVPEQKQTHLANCYFDTPDLALRKLDMGLRVRRKNNHIEQTIKTSGKVLAGLHTRPEFNVDISEPFPALELFPEHLWQSENQRQALQTQIVSLFSTDFERTTWTFDFQQSKFELALDYGEISAEGAATDIAELEIELVQGEATDLIAFAERLVCALSLRPGKHSKAARGYRLFSNQEDSYIENVSLAMTPAKVPDNEIALFEQGVSYFLEQLQTSIDNYFQQKKLSHLNDLVDVLCVLRHGFWVFDEFTSNSVEELRNEISFFIEEFSWVDNAIYVKELVSKSGIYRKKLDYCQQLVDELKIEKQHFPQEEDVVSILTSERFNKLQLSLLSLLIKHESNSSTTVDKAGVQEFAKTKLSVSLTKLLDTVQEIEDEDAEHYLTTRSILHRSLLSGNWFGFLFDDESRQAYRTPWIDLQQGLRELQSLWIVKKQLDKLTDETPEIKKVTNWHHGKVENLLVAIGHTKQAALNTTPYWQL